jgi:hypothetical protein
MGLIDLFGSSEPNDPIEELRQLFDERETTLRLGAEYGTPNPNTQDEPTVTFPYTVYTSDGERYSSGQKEFFIPDDGLLDRESALVDFLSKVHSIPRDDVTFDHLIAVDGHVVGAELNSHGDLVVGAI